jgi:hypothetical protein
VADDIQKESTAVPSVRELVARRPTKRNPTEEKRPGIVRDVLFPSLALLADEHHGFEFLEAALCNADRGEERADRLRIGDCAGRPDQAIRSIWRRTVPELFQNAMYLTGKGF